MADYEEISGKGIIFGDTVTTKRIADGTNATVKDIYISGTRIANDVSLDVGTLSGGNFGENCCITANQEPQTRYNVVEVGSIGNNSTIFAQNIKVRGLSNSVIGRGANLQAKHRIYVEDRIRDKATLKAEEIIVKGAIVGSGAQLEADEKISVGLVQ